MAEFKLSISMVDAYTGRKTRSFTIEAADFAAADIAAGLFLSDYANASGMRILWYRLTGKTVYTDTATAGVKADTGMTAVVRKADNELAHFNIPGPEEAIINTDGTLDKLDGITTALMAHFLSGTVRLSDHEVVTELVSGSLDQ